MTTEQQENINSEAMYIRVQLKRKKFCLLDYFLGEKKAETITLY